MIFANWNTHVKLRQSFVFICRMFPSVDFFPDLISTLVTALDMPNMDFVHNILSFVNDLFKGFRHDSLDDSVLSFRDNCVNYFSASLFKMFLQLSGQPQFIEEHILCCRIFYSLGFVNMPDVFQTPQWIHAFFDLFTTNYGPGALDLLSHVDSCL